MPKTNKIKYPTQRKPPTKNNLFQSQEYSHPDTNLQKDVIIYHKQ